MARRIGFSQAAADAVCAALAQGRSLYWAGRQDGAPGPSTLNGWMAARPDFALAVAEARAAGAAARGGRPAGRYGAGGYSAALAGEVAARVRAGRSVRAVCADADMPSLASVYRWRGRHAGFAVELGMALAKVPARVGMRGGARACGRPRVFGDRVAEAILERVMGGESLRQICRDAGMPAASTVLRWRIERPDFARAYATAREGQIEMLADEMLELADTAPDLARARLQIDVRKWRAMSLSCRTGRGPTAADAEAEAGPYADLSDEDLDARIDAALDALAAARAAAGGKA